MIVTINKLIHKLYNTADDCLYSVGISPRLFFCPSPSMLKPTFLKDTLTGVDAFTNKLFTTKKSVHYGTAKKPLCNKVG